MGENSTLQSILEEYIYYPKGRNLYVHTTNGWLLLG